VIGVIVIVPIWFSGPSGTKRSHELRNSTRAVFEDELPAD
jgi:hypothetical protein